MSNPERPRLQLVPSNRRVKIDFRSLLRAHGGVQGTLFPDARPGMVIFVNVPDVEEGEFEEVIRFSRPSCIVDLRLAPRFDLGRLNRAEAFRLFGDVEAAYIDATSPSVVGNDPKPGADCLYQLFRGLQLKAERPVVFLLGTEATSIASDQEVIGLMMHAGKQASEVVKIPTFQIEETYAPA